MQNNPGARAQPASLLLNPFTGIRREKLFPGDLQFRPLSPKHALVDRRTSLSSCYSWSLNGPLCVCSCGGLGRECSCCPGSGASVASVQLVWGEGTAGFAAAANTCMNTTSNGGG